MRKAITAALLLVAGAANAEGRDPVVIEQYLEGDSRGTGYTIVVPIPEKERLELKQQGPLRHPVPPRENQPSRKQNPVWGL